MKWRIYIVISVLLVLSGVKNVHAYIDPGTGSYILQIVLASIISIPLLLSGQLKKIRSIIAKILPSKSNDSD